MEKLGSAVLWTDKITLAMQEAYLWEADGQSSEAVAEMELAEECKTAFDLTPEHTRSLLAKEAKRMSELDFAIFLRDRFDGLYWSKNPDGTPRPRPGDVSLLKAVYSLLRHYY